MKRILFLLLSLLGFVSCEYLEEQINNQYVRVLPTSELQLPCSASTTTLTVESSGKWSVTGTNDWCEVAPMEGVDGDEIVISVLENDLDEERSVELTISCGSAQTKISVVQEKRLETDYVDMKCNDANHPHAVDLGLSVKWACCNVGATAPEEYGDYFAWGETSPKEEYTEDNCSTNGVSMTDISGNPAYDAATANWGGAWRMPTHAEIIELYDSCTWEWTTLNGVNGMRVTGPNDNSIFLPAAGCRYGSSYGDVGSFGFFWSSSPYEDNDYRAYYFNFLSGAHDWSWDTRGYGQSVRPVSE